MTGNMELFSFNGNSVTNTSSTTWNTAGLNLYLSGGATIYTGPLTTFVFEGPDNFVNNTGTININPGASAPFNLTSFIGSDFVFPPDENLAFNNSGGLQRIEPFVMGSVWHEFDGDNSVQLSSAGFILPIADDTEGTYGEVGGGINIFSLNGGFSAFAKGDVRISDDIDGVSGKAGLRFTW